MLSELAEARTAGNIKKIEKAEADVLKAQENLQKAIDEYSQYT